MDLLKHRRDTQGILRSTFVCNYSRARKKISANNFYLYLKSILNLSLQLRLRRHLPWVIECLMNDLCFREKTKCHTFSLLADNFLSDVIRDFCLFGFFFFFSNWKVKRKSLKFSFVSASIAQFPKCLLKPN